MRHRRLPVVILIAAVLSLSPLYLDAKTKTVSGTITSVEGGNGSVGTTIKISLGSNSGLKEGSMGWVSKDDETIAYIKVISVNANSSAAVVTAHQNVNMVTSGLPVSFKVEVAEPKPEIKPESKSELKPEKKTNHEDAVKWFEKGQGFRKNGDYATAVECYTNAIASDSNYIEAYDNRAFCYNEMGRYEEAVKDCSKEISLKPDTKYGYSRRAYAYNHLGRYGDAIEDCNKAIIIDPRDKFSYNSRGVAYYYLGNRDQALRDYSTACDLGNEEGCQNYNTYK